MTDTFTDKASECQRFLDHVYRPIRTIQELVEQATGITIASQVGRNQRRPFATARQIGMYLAKEFTDCSLNEIGYAFNREGKVAGVGIQAIIYRRETQPEFDRKIAALETAFKARMEVPDAK